MEDAIGCCDCYGGEYGLTSVCRVEVVPVWSKQVVQVDGGQAIVTEIHFVVTCKLQVAVGRDVGRNESLIVKGNREGQTYKGCAIVGMVANIEGAGHDGAGSGGNRIIVRRAPSTGISDFQLIRKGWRQTRERRGRTGGASLHAAVFRSTIVGSHPIEDVKEAALALIEHHFKVGRATSAKISRDRKSVV